MTNSLKVKTLHDTEAKLVDHVNNRDSWWASTIDNGSLFKISSGGNKGTDGTLKVGAVVLHGQSACSQLSYGRPPPQRPAPLARAALWGQEVSPRRLDTNARLRWRSTACPEVADPAAFDRPGDHLLVHGAGARRRRPAFPEHQASSPTRLPFRPLRRVCAVAW